MAFHPELERAFSLEGKVAVITGAGSGIARETARVFALAGAHVVAADIDEAGLAGTMDLLREAGCTGSSRRTDVSSLAEMQALADAVIAGHGSLDIWINAAGLSFLHTLLDTDPARAERTVAVNMMGPLWGCMAAGRVMRDQGRGVIVNVSSAGGTKPLPGIAVYGMTKAAVNSLTWTAAAELGQHGIRVNAIAPGWVETPMASKMYVDASGQYDSAKRDKVLSEMARLSPLGINGQPIDMAHAMLYLASDASKFVTGQVLPVT